MKMAHLIRALGLLAWTAAAAIGQDLEGEIQKARAVIAKAKKEIQRADAEAQRTDSLMRDEAARAGETEERQAKDRERRDKEIVSLLNRLKESQGRIDAERNSLARHQNAVDEIKSREKQLARGMAAWCESLALRVERQLPWDNQARLDRIHALKRDLEAGSASAEEGLTRLSAILKEEVKAGDEIALFNRPMPRKSGESVNAQVLRLGNQYLVYMDEDGKRFGILERKGDAWEWREELAFGEKNRVKEAVEVKGAKRPPSLVVLDLGLAAKEAPPAAGAPAAPKGGAR
jgi:chromosome segregation ATPase